jgi:hypothetical protein
MDHKHLTDTRRDINAHIKTWEVQENVYSWLIERLNKMSNVLSANEHISKRDVQFFQVVKKGGNVNLDTLRANDEVFYQHCLGKNEQFKTGKVFEVSMVVKMEVWEKFIIYLAELEGNAIITGNAEHDDNSSVFNTRKRGLSSSSAVSVHSLFTTTLSNETSCIRLLAWSV